MTSRTSVPLVRRGTSCSLLVSTERTLWTAWVICSWTRTWTRSTWTATSTRIKMSNSVRRMLCWTSKISSSGTCVKRNYCRRCNIKIRCSACWTRSRVSSRLCSQRRPVKLACPTWWRHSRAPSLPRLNSSNKLQPAVTMSVNWFSKLCRGMRRRATSRKRPVALPRPLLFSRTCVNASPHYWPSVRCSLNSRRPREATTTVCWLSSSARVSTWGCLCRSSSPALTVNNNRRARRRTRQSFPWNSNSFSNSIRASTSNNRRCRWLIIICWESR